MTVSMICFPLNFLVNGLSFICLLLLLEPFVRAGLHLVPCYSEGINLCGDLSWKPGVFFKGIPPWQTLNSNFVFLTQWICWKFCSASSLFHSFFAISKGVERKCWIECQAHNWVSLLCGILAHQVLAALLVLWFFWIYVYPYTRIYTQSSTHILSQKNGLEQTSHH